VNVKEAEAILALSLEIENALVIAAAPIDDIHGRFAAERAIERSSDRAHLSGIRDGGSAGA
jgi:hypothetical protein